MVARTSERTARVTFLQAPTCVSFQVPGEIGERTASGEAFVASKMTSPVDARCAEYRAVSGLHSQRGVGDRRLMAGPLRDVETNPIKVRVALNQDKLRCKG